MWKAWCICSENSWDCAERVSGFGLQIVFSKPAYLNPLPAMWDMSQLRQFRFDYSFDLIRLSMFFRCSLCFVSLSWLTSFTIFRFDNHQPTTQHDRHHHHHHQQQQQQPIFLRQRHEQPKPPQQGGTTTKKNHKQQRPQPQPHRRKWNKTQLCMCFFLEGRVAPAPHVPF